MPTYAVKRALDRYIESIPKDVVGNLAYRQKLVAELTKSKSHRESFMNMCIERPEIAFDSVYWTFNPRNEPGKRHLPFVLRPAERVAVRRIKIALDTGKDLLVNKSREEGATWVVCGTFFTYWWLMPDSLFLVGSRKEDLVDKAGDRNCIMYRFVYLNDKLPECFKIHEAVKTHLHFENPRNGSVIDGEATNENFGAGGRALGIMLDEFGRVKHDLAQSIRETVSDVANCVIYNSTHFYGRGHPFAKLLYSNKVEVIWLPWHKNPEKNPGLYRSPELNQIEILDADYYRKQYPKVFDDKTIYTYSELEKDMLLSYPKAEITLKADGEKRFRSPWYDEQEARRDPRDIAQNIDMNPIGAGDCFFDPKECEVIRQNFVRDPEYTGEVEYDLHKTYKINNVRFTPNAGRNQFSWWGQLNKNRPLQEHNYIVACDISMGVGASNSVAGVYDVNTLEKVGMFVSPNLSVDEFADQTIAICNWVGGASHRPFLIWEANGPGMSFSKRVINYHQYHSVFTMRAERHKQRKKSAKIGWYSNRETKYDLLMELRMALSGGLNPSKRMAKRLIVHDEKTVTEYEDYIFYDSGEVGLSNSMDESSGAKSAHGDRVIPDGLFVLALSDQPRAAAVEKAKNSEGSLAWRRQEYRKNQISGEGGPWLI